LEVSGLRAIASCCCVGTDLPREITLASIRLHDALRLGWRRIALRAIKENCVPAYRDRENVRSGNDRDGALYIRYGKFLMGMFTFGTRLLITRAIRPRPGKGYANNWGSCKSKNMLAFAFPAPSCASSPPLRPSLQIRWFCMRSRPVPTEATPTPWAARLNEPLRSNRPALLPR